MLALLIAIAAFIALAVYVVRWAADDLAATGSLSAKSLAASWLLYVLHADTVASAAWGGVLAVDITSSVALATGAVLILMGLTLSPRRARSRSTAILRACARGGW